MKWVLYGPDALLIQFASRWDEDAFNRARAIVASLEADPPEGLVEFVPAYSSLLLEFDPRRVPDPGVIAEAVVARLERAASEAVPEAPITRIDVVYDGPDLERVATFNGLTVEKVRTLHSEVIYTVCMLGFSPGFPYLGGLNARLHTPRLSSPRTTVPAGSVAIGGAQTGIYPVASPGGWNLIGRTEMRLFDPAALEPKSIFRLKQGDRVRFVGVGS